MVNAALTTDPRDLRDAERALVLGYAPAAVREALAALLALDARLGAIVAAAREPIVGQMRLTWWHEALGRLDTAPPPGEPVLQALTEHVLPRGVRGAALAAIVDGWEVLLAAESLDAEARATYAQARGEPVFAAAGVLLGAGGHDPLAQAGRGWALADLVGKVSDAAVSAEAAGEARALLDAACAVRWSARARALGAMAHAARLDLAGVAVAGPRRVARLAWHRLTGR